VAFQNTEVANAQLEDPVSMDVHVSETGFQPANVLATIAEGAVK